MLEDKKSGLIKIINDDVTPGQVMQALYNAGKNDNLELKNVSTELEDQIKDWEDILTSKPSQFKV